MEVLFLGVGEACDPFMPNTSILLKTDQGTAGLLLDCGFSTPHLFFQQSFKPDELKVLWISHFHGDHFFGVPLLLLQFQEAGRGDPLEIVGPVGLRSKVNDAMELAYAGCFKRFEYEVMFTELSSGDAYQTADYGFKVAQMDHSQNALAVRIEYNNKSVFYSGDGRNTENTLQLALQTDLVINEAFRITGETPGHGSLKDVLTFAKGCQCKRIVLVHIAAAERRKNMGLALKLINESCLDCVSLPIPGDIIVI